MTHDLSKCQKTPWANPEMLSKSIKKNQQFYLTVSHRSRLILVYFQEKKTVLKETKLHLSFSKFEKHFVTKPQMLNL